jgi:hypothetical protein
MKLADMAAMAAVVVEVSHTHKLYALSRLFV